VGTDWGKRGFATLPYEDWLDSAYDAWVTRPGGRDWQDQQPGHGVPGHLRQLPVRPHPQPFAPAKNSGGSSGGSAAAVADGLLPLAEGTDGGGSIRIPASWYGVYGYKAFVGRIPYVNRPNAFSGVNPFLFEGPITRTVEDAALALDALAGYDSRDPFSLDQADRFMPAVGRSISGWRIAYSPDFDVFPVDKRVTEVVSSAVRAFEQAGAQVEQVRLGIERDQRELSDLWCRLIMPVNVETFENVKRNGLDLLADHRDDFPPEYLRPVPISC
jgi:amidase